MCSPFTFKLVMLFTIHFIANHVLSKVRMLLVIRWLHTYNLNICVSQTGFQGRHDLYKKFKKIQINIYMFNNSVILEISF